MNKRKFKGTNISVTESLTSLQLAKLKDARGEYGFNKVWTSDGRIMVMEKGSAKPKVIYGKLSNQQFYFTYFGGNYAGTYLGIQR